MTGCSSLSADDANSASGVGSGASVPDSLGPDSSVLVSLGLVSLGAVSATTSSGFWDGVRAGRPGRSGWPGPGWPGDGLDSAWSIVRVLAEDRFLDSHTVMNAPDERPYSYLKSTIDQRATIW